jgi:hypothetical protein
MVTSAGFMSRLFERSEEVYGGMRMVMESLEANSAGVKVSSFVLMLMAMHAANVAMHDAKSGAEDDESCKNAPQSASDATQIFRAFSSQATSETLRDLKRLRRSRAPSDCSGAFLLSKLRKMNQRRLLLLVSKNDALGILKFLNGSRSAFTKVLDKGVARQPTESDFALEEEDFFTDAATKDSSNHEPDDRYMHPNVDYSLPIHLRGGVDVDAFDQELGIAGGDGEGGVQFTFADDGSIEGLQEAQDFAEGATNGGAAAGSTADQDADETSSVGSSGWGSDDEDAAEMKTCALHLACQLGHSATVRVLIAGLHEDGVPLLYETGGAPAGGRDAMITSRFDGGCVSLETVNSDGWTAAHFAVVAPRNGAEIIRILAAAGAKLTTEANNGYTPFALRERLGGGRGRTT